jgi:adenosylcobinamide-phosphate synthase
VIPARSRHCHRGANPEIPRLNGWKVGEAQIREPGDFGRRDQPRAWIPDGGFDERTSPDPATSRASLMSRFPVAAGLMLGLLADELVGDPARRHPVAGFGTAASVMERRIYADSSAAGVGFAAMSVLPICLAGWVAERALTRRPLLRTAAVAAATWTVVGGRSLRGVGSAMAAHLEAGRTEDARALVPSLCGRDPNSLNTDGMARATVESIAENTSDSVVAPLFWGAVAGLPGLLSYRAVNTLDAMVGHRSPRYARFGTAAARTDDVLNLAPARLTAALTVAGAKSVAGSPRASWRAWRSDAAQHPSPNAGHCEAAMAGALGVQLGGKTTYASGTEDRPVLGSGSAPAVADIDRAVRLSRLVQASALAVLAGGVVVVELLRQRGRR